MTYEKIVIPMDHGNRNMKTKEEVFTSGLEESDMKPILGDYLMYDGKYYSPAYIDKELYMDKADKRRTLYWNPTVQTDENGKAVIECYNNQYSTPLIIQAETLSNDGKLGSVTYSTVAETK